MRLCVVAPSQDYLGLAGVRIRYNRIAPRLRQYGHELLIEVIDQYRTTDQFVHDAYLFSKCYDVRSLLIATMLRGQGKLVGVDMFDDYFSQSSDSRFVAHRDWLRSMSRRLDFFLCSTPRMRDVTSAYAAGVPGHMLNDPFDEANRDLMQNRLQENLARTLAQRRLEVAWFGVGDNPHFQVGLSDLHGFASALQSLRGTGMEVGLSILTNRRALDASALERLRQLPVAWTLEEWTVEREQALLARSLVSFIPVNAQAFSIAKSLNRAVTALTAGSQVLSPGFPLYEPVEAFVYRSAAELVDELQRRRLRLRGDTISPLLEALAIHGDPEREAHRLATFLDGLRSARHPADGARLQAVVQGVRTISATHQMAQRFKHLSVGSPFSSESLNYDLRFTTQTDGCVRLQLTDAAAARLAGGLQRRLTKGLSPTGRAVRVLDIDSMAAVEPLRTCAGDRTRAHQLVAYEPVMTAINAVLSDLYPGIVLHRSEGEAPFHAPPPVEPA